MCTLSARTHVQVLQKDVCLEQRKVLQGLATKISTHLSKMPLTGKPSDSGFMFLSLCLHGLIIDLGVCVALKASCPLIQAVQNR